MKWNKTVQKEENGKNVIVLLLHTGNLSHHKVALYKKSKLCLGNSSVVKIYIISGRALV